MDGSSDTGYGLEAARRPRKATLEIPLEGSVTSVLNLAPHRWPFSFTVSEYSCGRSFRLPIQQAVLDGVWPWRLAFSRSGLTQVYAVRQRWGTLSWHCSWQNMVPPYWFSVSGMAHSHCFSLHPPPLPPQANSEAQLGGRGLKDKLQRNSPPSQLWPTVSFLRILCCINATPTHLPRLSSNLLPIRFIPWWTPPSLENCSPLSLCLRSP